MARGKPWADVEALEWETNAHEAKNALKIEDFCRYRYVIQTEGIGYSGRLQFHQLCESVVLGPALEWVQHTSNLIKPIYSSTILGPSSSSSSVKHPSKLTLQSWPREYSIHEANMIFVASDWSDLEAMLAWLEDHQDVAATIARNQRQTYSHDGYLSPAAEVCYWRAVLRGWEKVAQPTGDGWNGEGKPFEEYMTGEEPEG